MEPPRTVYQIVIQLTQAVTGNDKKFFPLGCPIKQAQEPGLRIPSIVSGAGAAKGFVKLIKQKNSLLLNRLNV